MAKGTTAKDLRDKSDDEIQDIIKTTRNALFEARFQNYTNRLDQTSKLRQLRRELARALTVAGTRQKSAKQSAATTTAAKGEG